MGWDINFNNTKIARNFFFIIAVALLNAFALSMVFSIFPALFLKPGGFHFSDHHAALSALGIAFGAAPLGELLIAPVIGKFSDRLGRKPFLQATLALNALAHVLFYVALVFANYGVLLLARLLIGAASGNLALAEANLSEVTPDQRRAFRFNFLQVSVGVGMLLGPMVAGYFLEQAELGRVILSVALLNAGLGAWATRYFTEAPTSAKPGKISKVSLRSKKGLYCLLLAWFIFMLGWTFYLQFFGVFLQSVLSLSPLQIGKVFGYLGVCYLGIQLVVVQWSTLRFRPEVVVLPAALFTGLFLGGMGFVHSLKSLYVFLFLYVFSMAIFIPNFNVLIARASEGVGQGMGFASLVSLRALTTVLVSVFGASFLVMSTRLPLWGAGIFILMSLFPLAWYLKTRHNLAS